MDAENRKSPEAQLAERIAELRGIFTGKSWVVRVPGEDQIIRLPVTPLFDYLEDELLEILVSGLCEFEVEETPDLRLVTKVIHFQRSAQNANVVPFTGRPPKTVAEGGRIKQSSLSPELFGENSLFPELFHEIQQELEATREARFKEQREAARERRKARKAVVARCQEKVAQLHAEYGDDIGIEFQTDSGDVFWYKPLFDFADA